MSAECDHLWLPADVEHVGNSYRVVSVYCAECKVVRSL